MRVGIVGAGPAGLAAARQLLRGGFDVELLERGGQVGGVWNYGRPQGRVYRSTHTISSKPTTEFPDFPLPDHFPDYPHHSQMLEYVQTYAQRFGLEQQVRFYTPVTDVAPEDRGRADTGWVVVTDDGERCRYDAVVLANGHNTDPRIPEWPGERQGTMLHSAEYRTPGIAARKRVLVVGAGNSGCDIAVDCAQVARTTLLSMRRGYHYVPKYVLGRPVDQIHDLALALRLPLTLRRWIARLAVRLGPGLPGDVGLPEPDHALFETHPIVNSLLPYYVRHGRIRPVPDVARLEGDAVRFVDDTAESVDVVILATGYRLTFPFIDYDLLNWSDGRPHLYAHLFHPHYDTLFVVGMFQTDSGVFRILHEQARCIALFLRAARQGDPVADRMRETKRDTGGGLGRTMAYRETPRHLLEVEHWSYLKGLERTAAMLEQGG